jgi:hypothetical protein
MLGSNLPVARLLSGGQPKHGSRTLFKVPGARCQSTLPPRVLHLSRLNIVVVVVGASSIGYPGW